MGIDPKDIVCVAAMPCAAKKYEANRPEMKDSGYQDVDAGLTTRELGLMIKQSGLNFAELEDGYFDTLMGKSTGAAVLFGATGGVMEAAHRTVYEVVTGRELPFENLNFTPARGLGKIKEATILLEECKEDWAFLNELNLKLQLLTV
jgi:iron only hydrogenase large subunit-like protein